MVGRLLAQRIEVGRAQNAIAVEEGNFQAGTYVVRLDQPYRNTLWICSRRRFFRRIRASLTTMCRGSFRRIFILRL